MNLALYFVALAASALFGLATGQWLTAFFILFILDSLLAWSSSRAGAARLFVNSLGTLTPNLIVARALELVFTVRPVLNNISLNFADLDSGAVEANYNAHVIGRTLSIPTVGNFRDAAQNRADTDVDITLNNFKQLLYTFTPEEISGTSRNLLDESAMPLAISMSNYMVDAVAAFWTAANFANNTAVAAGWSYTNTVLVLRKVLMQRGVPKGAPWFAVFNSDVYTSLLADPIVVAALNNPSNGNAIATGRLPSTAGLELDEYPSCPTTGNLLGFAGAKDSIVYAARVPKNPEQIPGFDAKFPGQIEIITNPKTKLSVMLNQWIGTDLSANIRLVWMYGMGKGNNNNGQRLTSV